MSIKRTRARSITHHTNMVEAAMEALMAMSKSPDVPTDLSEFPVGCLSILKENCEVKLLFSGNSAFGIMDLPEDDS